jgi:hypothetical protein
MIPSINSQLPDSSRPSGMSGHEQAREAKETFYSTGKTLSRVTESAPPSGDPDPAGYPLHSRRLTGTDLQFRVDRNTDQVVITVLRKDTGEVIREIPMKEPFSLAPTLDATETGQLIHAIA